MPCLVVVGSVNMDVVTPIRRLPAPGETLGCGAIQLVPGGKGANAAVAAARQGARVRFRGAVGDDAFGGTLRAGLAAEGIDVERLETVPGASGTAVILLDEGSGQNAILVGPGANHAFALAKDEGEAAALWAGADGLLLQLETPLTVVTAAARGAKAAGARVLLDPAPAVADPPAALLAACDLLTPNECELALLTGMPAGTEAEVRAAAAALRARTAGEVVVTLGSRGALWLYAGGELRAPTYAVQAVDTTAAGDTFAATLATAYWGGADRETALDRALAAGALAVTRLGARPSLPTAAEVDGFLACPPARRPLS